jgi:hypothetical protein
MIKKERISKYWLIISILIAFTLSSTTFGQNSVNKIPFVDSVFTKSNEIRLNSEVYVRVKNFTAFETIMKGSNKKVVLYIDDLALPGVYARFGDIPDSSDSRIVIFFIPRTQDVVEIWDQLALANKQSESFFEALPYVSIGLEGEGETSIISKIKYKLELADQKMFLFCSLIVVLLLISFILIIIKTDILNVSSYKSPNGKKAPYCLAHTQMAIWFFTIISSWLMLYVLRHSVGTITSSLVILMGISSATSIGNMATQTGKNNNKRQSRGFLRDIVSEDSGKVSFHKFQMLAWTLVLVIVFIRQVYHLYVMPEFDSSLLVLMGLSSGTYVAFGANPIQADPITPTIEPKEDVNEVKTNE